MRRGEVALTLVRASFPRAPYTCNWRYTADFACNWKIPVENTVETSTTRAWMFSLDGTKQNLFARVIARLAARHGVQANSTIQREDASIFAAQQKGIAATPFRGCIGTREERIWCFHRYLRSARGG